MSVTSPPSKYPLLEEFLELQQMSLQPTYALAEVAKLFGVSPRSIQSWVADGRIAARKIPGGTKCFPLDLEQFLRESKNGGSN